MRFHNCIRMLVSSMMSVLSLGLMAGAATSSSSNAPDPRDRINIWEGHWKVQAQRKETPYSHAGSFTRSGSKSSRSRSKQTALSSRWSCEKLGHDTSSLPASGDGGRPSVLSFSAFPQYCEKWVTSRLLN